MAGGGLESGSYGLAKKTSLVHYVLQVRRSMNVLRTNARGATCQSRAAAALITYK